MNTSQAIAKVIEREDLSRTEMQSVMQEIMTGEATPAQIAGFLIGLRMKGETVEEITAAAEVMRSLSTKVIIQSDSAVDIVGTGGDGSSTFNISTASIFVTAAAGATVAKHGNRSVSSQSGAADLLEAAGVNLDITPEKVSACINELGVGFIFAQKHHSAMKHAIGPRKEMAVRTLFNLLGPLTNPAVTPNMVLGVFSKQWVRPLAEVLQQLGAQHVMVVHAEDGMDEISIATKSYVAELKQGSITEYTICPEDFAMQRQALDSIKVGSPEQSLAMIQQVFDNTAGAAKDIVCLNAGAAIYVAGLVDSHQAGVINAQQVITEGLALEKLNALINKTNT
ncbi:MAG: anthranilate phosphoribosyltransferase [Thiotrichaceae bacterium]|nr:anthranilate phosphoribosyltransferase [Thiotrichaceae bacterium]